MAAADVRSKMGAGLSELWSRLLFVALALVVFRIGTHVPVPGINGQVLQQLMDQQQGTLLALFNVFTGGALERASIFEETKQKVKR